MTTTTTLATVETALAGIGQAAIERARNGKELAINARLRAHADELRARVADLITRKPDPATWTPDEHATFILVAEAPTGFDVRTDVDVSAEPATPPVCQNWKPSRLNAKHDGEIPF